MFAEALAAYAKLKPLANREAQATALLHAGQAAAKKRLAELNAGRAGALPKASKRSDH